MIGYIKKFEKMITVSLVVMMAVVVLLATIELGWLIVVDIISPPLFLLEVNELLEIFGLFLLVLIGVELLETIKAYLKENVVHVEVVFTVALIAVARKVIIIDVKDLTGLTLIGIAAIIICLSAGYYLVKKGLGHTRKAVERESPGPE